MKKLTPNLAVKNIKETIEYYQKNFGFEIAMAVSEDKSSMGRELLDDKEYVWAMIVCKEVTLMLQQTDNYSEDIGVSVNELGATATLYIEVEDVDALYSKVKDSVNIIKEIDTTWYGQREFYLRDCNGYILAFATMQQQE